MNFVSRTALTAVSLLLLAAPAHAAGPADVTVRIEGEAATLLPRTAVTTTVRDVNKDGDPAHTCTGTSALGALDTAVGGDWDGSWYFSYSVERIRTETHMFNPDAAANRYWTFWLNYQYSNNGFCETELQAGDEILVFPGCYGECANPTPLRLSVPATATPGRPFEVSVSEYVVSYDDNYVGTTSSRPAAGATVDVGDRSVTTGADGKASITLGARGPQLLRASKPGHVRSSSEPVCLSDGSDGFCGSEKPAEAAPPCLTNGADGLCGTRDRSAPVGRITGIAEQQRFTRAGAPRELTGTVSADPSGLFAVKLRLTRRHRGRCQYFSGRLEEFRRTRCGRSFAFRLGDRADWSYLLPAALPAGRYVLDVIAIDKAFNRDALARGRNRIVFEVA